MKLTDSWMILVIGLNNVGSLIMDCSLKYSYAWESNSNL